MAAKCKVEPGTHLYPTPAVMVSCASEFERRPNIIAIAWTGVLASSPPTIGVGVTPARHSHRLIADSGEFVINLPRTDQVDLLDYCGVVSGRDEDKFSACSLTPTPADVLRWAPLIAECPVNLECRVIRRLPLGSHEYFVGEVVRTHVSEEWVDDRGRLVLPAEQLFAYSRGRYHQLGKRLGRHGFSRGSGA